MRRFCTMIAAAVALAAPLGLAGIPEAEALGLVESPLEFSRYLVRYEQGGRWHDYQLCYGGPAASAAALELRLDHSVNARAVYQDSVLLCRVSPYGTDPRLTGRWHVWHQDRLEQALSPSLRQMAPGGSVRAPRPVAAPPQASRTAPRQRTKYEFFGIWEGDYTNDTLRNTRQPWKTRRMFTVKEKFPGVEVIFTDSDGRLGSGLGPNPGITLYGWVLGREALKVYGTYKGCYDAVHITLGQDGAGSCRHWVFKDDQAAAPYDHGAGLEGDLLYQGQWRNLKKTQ